MRSTGVGELARVAATAMALAILAGGLPKEWSSAAGTPQGDPADAKKVPIYVSDFELFSSAVTGPAPKAATSPSGRQPGASIYADTDPTPVQARRVMDAFATMLVQAFQKNGYTASRVTGQPGPNGVLLRGVFTEPDDKNRIRRAILGAGAPSPTFTLYVGAFNLGHQDQPLYQPAPVQSPDSHYGPVITMNAYVPMVKFDVDKSPVEEDVRKICGQIVSQLAKLLADNPNAVPK